MFAAGVLSNEFNLLSCTLQITCFCWYVKSGSSLHAKAMLLNEVLHKPDKLSTDRSNLNGWGYRGVTGKGQVLPATAVPLLSLCCLGRGGCGDIFLLKTLGDFNMYSGPRLGTLSYLWIKKPTL